MTALRLPASADVAIAYVFVDIFPHLAMAQSRLDELIESNLYGFLTHHLYLVSLVGLCVYLGIIRSVRKYRVRDPSSIT